MGTELRVYVAVFLFRKDRVLLLRRAETRAFAPGLWTGVGGRVEVSELADLEGAALREVAEETGLGSEDIRDLRVRVVLVQPEGGNVVNLVFLTGHTDRENVGTCEEGSLHWVALDRVKEVDMIENAGRALEIVLGNRQEGVRFGVCEPGIAGELKRITLAPEFFDL